MFPTSYPFYSVWWLEYLNKWNIVFRPYKFTYLLILLYLTWLVMNYVFNLLFVIVNLNFDNISLTIPYFCLSSMRENQTLVRKYWKCSLIKMRCSIVFEIHWSNSKKYWRFAVIAFYYFPFKGKFSFLWHWLIKHNLAIELIKVTDFHNCVPVNIKIGNVGCW